MTHSSPTPDHKPLNDVSELLATVDEMLSAGAVHEETKDITGRQVVRRFADCVLRFSEGTDDTTSASRELELVLARRLAVLKAPNEPRS